MHVAMVGNCEGRLLELLGPPDQVGYPVRTVKEGILGMAMQMYERHFSL
jgi:hypothetical protein